MGYSQSFDVKSVQLELIFLSLKLSLSLFVYFKIMN